MRSEAIDLRERREGIEAHTYTPTPSVLKRISENPSRIIKLFLVRVCCAFFHCVLGCGGGRGWIWAFVPASQRDQRGEERTNAFVARTPWPRYENSLSLMRCWIISIAAGYIARPPEQYHFLCIPRAQVPPWKMPKSYIFLHVFSFGLCPAKTKLNLDEIKKSSGWVWYFAIEVAAPHDIHFF